MSKLRVLLADDHPVVRRGLRAMLDAVPDLTVVGEASDGEAAIQETIRLHPDVVVMDVSMPGMNGVEATSELTRRCPEVRVVALTAHEDRSYLQQLLAAGAIGFVMKRAAPEDLVQAITRAAAGEAYLDLWVAKRFLAETAMLDAEPTGDALSEREVEVLQLVAQGLLDSEIGTRLQLDVAAVVTSKVDAMAKLGVKTRAGVIRYALQQGWLANE